MCDIVEAPAPRVAKAKAPDLAKIASLPHKGVARGDDVSLGVIQRDRHVESKHLAEQARGVLCAVVWIVAAAPVAHADVQKPVRSEREIAAVVIGERVEDERLSVRPDEVEPRAGVGDERIAIRSKEPGDHDMAGRVRKADIEPPRGSVVGRKREAKQPLFRTMRDVRGEVEKRRGQQRAVLDDLDDAALLDDILQRGVRRVLHERDGVGKS